MVLPSADLEACVRTAVNARVQNNGQSCIAAKRFIVVDEVHDEFLERFAAAMDALVVGDPFDPGTDIGPIVTEAQRDELRRPGRGGRAQGATVHAGATLPTGDGWWFAPTVLSGVTTDMPVAQEEIFGPVAMVMRVPDLDAAIAVANATTFGLGSSVWTERRGRARGAASRRSRRAPCSSTPWWPRLPELPFGGIKRSGYGRELSELGSEGVRQRQDGLHRLDR